MDALKNVGSPWLRQGWKMAPKKTRFFRFKKNLKKPKKSKIYAFGFFLFFGQILCKPY